MNDKHHPRHDDDIASLFQRTEPNPIPVDVEQIIKSNLDSFEKPNYSNLQRRQKVRTRTAILVGVAASIILLLQFPFVSAVGIAFADVKERVERIRTVDYVEIAVSEKPKPRPEGVVDTRFGKDGSAEATLKKVVDSLESDLKTARGVAAEELRFPLGLLKPLLSKEEHELPDNVRRVRIKGKHLQRTDHYFPFNRLHSVTNANDEKTVSFNHNRKEKRTLTKQVTISDASGERSEEDIKVSKAVDFFERFRAIPTQATKRLPQRKVDGQDAIGFQSVQKEKNGTWTRTYWVHPESKLPIQIVIEFQSTRERLSSSRWVQSHFVFDSEMDDSLFSTDTPKGYSAKDGKILGITF